MSGAFIVIEGPDGAGTTLHSKLLAERLKREGHDSLLTAEPTDGEIGTWIRQILKNAEGMPASSLQLLFCADRAWHIEKVITPALAAGTTVICDRYSPSTIIYGEYQGLDSNWLKSLNSKFIQPDRTLILLPPFEVCMVRIARRKQKDFFEAEPAMKKIYDGYVKYAKEHPEIAVIDTSGEKDEVAEMIYRKAISPVS